MKKFRKVLYVVFVVLLIAFVMASTLFITQSVITTSSNTISNTVGGGHSANDSTSGFAISIVSHSASSISASGTQSGDNSSGSSSSSCPYQGTTLPAGGDLYGYWDSNDTNGVPEFYCMRVGDDDLNLVTLVEVPSFTLNDTHFLGAYIVYPAAYNHITGQYYIDVDNPYDVLNIYENGGYVHFFNLADEVSGYTPDSIGDGYDALFGGSVPYDCDRVFVIPVIVEVYSGQDPDYPLDLSDMSNIEIIQWNFGEGMIYEYDI